MYRNLIGISLVCILLGSAPAGYAQETIASSENMWKGGSASFPLLTQDPFDAYYVFSNRNTRLWRRVNLPVLDHAPGLFCKWESTVEKKSRIAPRIRLGSLAYTEWMEGKKDLRFRYMR